MTSEAGEARSHTRDKALRRTRALVAGAAAGAVGLSGVLSAVAAQAFKGHPHRSASPPAAVAKTAPPSRYPAAAAMANRGSRSTNGAMYIAATA